MREIYSYKSTFSPCLESAFIPKNKSGNKKNYEKVRNEKKNLFVKRFLFTVKPQVFWLEFFGHAYITVNQLIGK